MTIEREDDSTPPLPLNWEGDEVFTGYICEGLEGPEVGEFSFAIVYDDDDNPTNVLVVSVDGPDILALPTEGGLVYDIVDETSSTAYFKGNVIVPLAHRRIP